MPRIEKQTALFNSFTTSHLQMYLTSAPKFRSGDGPDRFAKFRKAGQIMPRQSALSDHTAYFSTLTIINECWVRRRRGRRSRCCRGSYVRCFRIRAGDINKIAFSSLQGEAAAQGLADHTHFPIKSRHSLKSVSRPASAAHFLPKGTTSKLAIRHKS